MTRTLPTLALLLFTACGLVDDARDEKNKNSYLTFVDPAFEKFCLEKFDQNHDGRISHYEAQRVPAMDCAGYNIEQMWEIGEFSHLQRLDCSNNLLTQLDLRDCRDLRVINCSHNQLSELNITGLRGINSLDCSYNQLENLNLGLTTALTRLDGRANRFVTLDLQSCSAQLQADLRDNASLSTVYCRQSQGVTADGNTEVIAN